jgi:WD40 repeat protein
LKKARDRARRTANNGSVLFVFPLDDSAHCFLALLSSLKPVTSASWDVVDLPMCMTDTRRDIIDDTLSWAESGDTYVFWLNGNAGTGKSTIARTVCQKLEDVGLLGASFFVTQSQKDRREASNIIISLAHQLALSQGPVLDALCSHLKARPATGHRSLERIVTDYFTGPAKAMDVESPLVIVIDSLDECFLDNRGRPGGDLLPLLVKSLVTLSGRLRLLVTSRAEPATRKMFQQLLESSQQRVIDIQDPHETLAHVDFRTYLTRHFTDLRAMHTRVDLTDWPSAIDLEHLVRLSESVFLYGFIVLRTLHDANCDPRARLGRLIEKLERQHPPGCAPYYALDRLYLQLLVDAAESLINPQDSKELFCQRFRTIAGVLTVAQQCLSFETLACFCDASPDDIRRVVQALSPLLQESDNSVYFLHHSFADFVTNASRCTDHRFHVAVDMIHGALASRCLSLMNNHLRYDICAIDDATVANAEVIDLEARIHTQVSNAVVYASSFWMLHVAASGSGTPDDVMLERLMIFSAQHLLHWLEILSLMGYLDSVASDLLEAAVWCEVCARLSNRLLMLISCPTQRHLANTKASLVGTLLSDAVHVLEDYSWPIRSHALQAYHSAFVLMPHSLLRDMLSREALPNSLSAFISTSASARAQPKHTMNAHTRQIRSVAFSPDGTRMLSCADDMTQRIWDATTMRHLAQLSPDQGWISVVAFSPNGTRMFTGTGSIVRVWDATTFELVRELECENGGITSFAFHPDNVCIACGNSDDIRIWGSASFDELARLGSGVLLRSAAKTVAFSWDGSRLVSGHSGGYREVRIWSTATFELLAELRGHQQSINSVSFSPDDTHVVSGSEDGTVRIWNMSTFEQVAMLQGYDGERVKSVTFLLDGTLQILRHSVSHTYDNDAPAWKDISSLTDLYMARNRIRYKTVTMSDKFGWVKSLSSGRALFWLPWKYCGDFIGPWGSRIVVGGSQGAVSILDFAV